MKVAFIGPGVMGYPIAGHLQRSGCDVSVYNRSPERASAWLQEYGGRVVETPCLAANGAELAFTCVGNDDDVRSVVFGEEGVLAGQVECFYQEVQEMGGGRWDTSSLLARLKR